VAFRLETARAGLAAYEKWLRDGTALTPEAMSDLASAARWFLAGHDPPARPAGERCER
jgi:hypothetical protein